MRVGKLAIVLGAIGFPVAAQQPPIQLPAGSAATEQNSSFQIAPATFTPSSVRHQILYGAGEFVGVGPRVWRGLNLRADQVGWSSAHRIELDLEFSTLGLPAPSGVSTRSPGDNRGSDATAVVQRLAVQLPQVAPRGGGPQPAMLIPFSVPFSYGGGTGLLVDVKWAGPARLLTPLDSQQASVPPWTIQQTVRGTSCLVNSTFGITVRNRPDRAVELAAQLTLPRQAMGIAGALAFGVAPAALPLDSLGAPGCTMWLRPDAAWFMWSNPQGTQQTVYFGGLTARLDPRMIGSQIYAQSFVVDPTANALGVRSSAAIALHLSSGPPVERSAIVSWRAGQSIGPPRFDLLPVLTLR